MGYLNSTKELVSRLYEQGSSSNEDLQLLLVNLKEISDSNPESLRDEFVQIFPDLNVNKESLESTCTMLMMLLTRLAMSHKATEDSAGYISKKQMETELYIKLRDAESTLRNYMHLAI